ncbi:SsrA-binding protein SmpB [bacterium]|nr:MAG: SsrA-binding protein SmpB [bacterium]
MKSLAVNKRARFDYDIKDTFDAGLVLEGREVKSAKTGNVSLTGSYLKVNAKGATLVGAHIGAYKYAPVEDYDPTQERQVLLNKKELNQLLGKDKGSIIVPLEIYIGPRNLIKLKIGVGFGRKKQDKREYIKTRDAKREANSNTDR